jgi:hypothetical protein
MRGFFATGAVPRLIERLRPVGADRFFSFSYGTAREGVYPFDAVPVEWGSRTLLWRGLSTYLRESARPGEVVALVTDNIQDAGAMQEEQHDVRQFYDALRASSDISHVYVLPLRLPFDGLLFGRDGTTPIGNYAEERGLVVYLITHGAVPEARIHPLAGRVAQAVGARAVRMKPFDTAPVEAVVDTALSRRAAASAQCPSQPLVPLPGEVGVLGRSEPVREKTPFGGTFVVRLRSAMEGVTLAQPHVSAATIPSSFRLTGATVSGEPRIYADPPRLQTDLGPGESAQVNVSVCFRQGLRFSSREAFWKFVTMREPVGTYEGKVTVRLETPRGDLHLADAVHQEFSVVDPAFFTRTDTALHHRVFRLEYAFREIAPEQVQMVIPIDYRVRFLVRYPRGPLLAVLVGLLAAAIAAWLLIRALVGSRGYLLAEEGPGRLYFGAASPARRDGVATGGAADPGGFLAVPAAGSPTGLGGGRPVSISFLRPHLVRLDGRPAAVIRRLPLAGVQVTARPGFLIDGRVRKKTLSPQGTAFWIGSAAEAGGEASPPQGVRRRTEPARSGGGGDPADFLR